LAFSNQFHFADKSSQRELAEPSNWQTINHPSGKSAQYPAYATIPGDAASEKPTESLFAPVGGTQFAALKMLKIQSDKYALTVSRLLLLAHFLPVGTESRCSFNAIRFNGQSRILQDCRTFALLVT